MSNYPTTYKETRMPKLLWLTLACVLFSLVTCLVVVFGSKINGVFCTITLALLIIWTRVEMIMPRSHQ